MQHRVALGTALLVVLALAAWLSSQWMQPEIETPEVPSQPNPDDAPEDLDIGDAAIGLVGTAVRGEENEAHSTDGTRTRWIEVHDGKQPIPNAVIRWSQFHRDGVPQLALGTTNPDGIARVRIKPRVHRIHVSAHGFLSIDRTLFDAASRARVRLWRAPKKGTVIVTDGDGLPVRRAEVLLRSTEAQVNEIGRTNKDGRIQFPMPAFGACEFTTQLAGFLPHVHQFDAAFVDDGATFPVTLRPVPITHGRVIDISSEEAVADVRIGDGVTETTSDQDGRFTFKSEFPTFLLDHEDFHQSRGNSGASVFRMARKKGSSPRVATPGPHVGLQGSITMPNGDPAVGVPATGGRGGVTYTDSNGHYALNTNHGTLGLDRGTWALQLHGTLHATTDVRLPGTARLQGQLHFPEGVAPHAARIRFDAGTGSEIVGATPSRGTVMQFRSQSGGGTASVEAPKVRVWARIESITTDATGRFEIDEVAVGEYTLRATPDPASDLIPAKVRFVLAHDGTHVDVPLSFGREFVVRVIDHRDAPVAGALVSIPRKEKSAYTDAKGEVRFAGIDDRTFNLYVSSAWGTMQRVVDPKRDADEIVMQLDARPTFTIALTRTKIRNGTQCHIQISEVAGRMVSRAYGRVRNDAIEGRLPSLDWNKQYEVGLKSDTHWSLWAPLDVADDGSKAHATVKVYRMDEEEEDAK